MVTVDRGGHFKEVPVRGEQNDGKELAKRGRKGEAHIKPHPPIPLAS